MTTVQEQPADATSVAFLLIPRFNMMALTSTIEPLRVANYLVGRQLYAWRFVSPDGGSVVASNGMALPTEPLPEHLPTDATLFVCGSWDSEHYDNPEVFAWLRQQDRRGIRLGAMDIGVYILARAGLIAKRRVAVLWYCIRAFSETYPDIQAKERLFVADGNRITIAGGTAGVDAMLADVGARYGARLAHEVADHILHHPIHTENDTQRSSVGGQQEIVHPVLRAAIEVMENNVEEPLSIPTIAARSGVSQRRLERLFVAHVGHSAVAYYRILRLQHARVLLTNTSLSIREIALACGYGSLSHFAKSFAQQFGKLPRDCRDAWPHGDPAPVWPGLSTSLIGMRPSRRR